MGAMTRDEISARLAAATGMDWRQVVLNGGPPCFYVERLGHFCGRAERWDGHSLTPDGLPYDHEYESLYALLVQVCRAGR